LLGRCLPKTYRTIYYGFKRIKEEQRLLIQQKKIMDAAGISSIQVETFWILLLNTALKKVGIVVLVEGSLPTEEMSRVRI
jgi:Na+-transporting NADH:ubiquinone oxidoreductase subunit NqrC